MRAAQSNDYTFAALRDFSRFDANILNIGTEGLEGYAVFTVVSLGAVYMVCILSTVGVAALEFANF
ncbi:hypothetical protein RRF57_005952 [Xylaria bambusicola]|uniref:Uncharacterized protein n=1 Tax=Xylaria bambusicola TaxID=326684 RepID=A0AAN7UKG6_9PEZI